MLFLIPFYFELLMENCLSGSAFPGFHPQRPLVFSLPPFTQSKKHLPAGTRAALLSPSVLQSRCHLSVWSLLTYTSVIKIPFLTSHPASGAWSVICRDIGAPGLTQMWLIGRIVFAIKGLAGGSCFVFFFKTYSSIDWLGMFFPGNLWY